MRRAGNEKGVQEKPSAVIIIIIILNITILFNKVLPNLLCFTQKNDNA